jgi:miniconductance mechanosensitive channel
MEYGELIAEWLHNLLVGWGVPESSAVYVKLLLLLVIAGVVAIIIDRITRRIILSAVIQISNRTATDIDDILVEKKVFGNLAHLAPAFFVHFIMPVIFIDFPELISFFREVVDVYIIIAIVLFVQSLLRAMNTILRKIPLFKEKPVESYTQLVNIFNYAFGILFIISELTGKSLLTFFTALGAASAVLILVFRDTIMGFVASIQLSANDMVKVGDWVSFTKYGADGTVEQINLTTIKVQNWDKTYTTIPTYAFISDAFKNWRGMEESGGRRIKRALQFKISSIRFCTSEMAEKYKKYELISHYIDHRQKDIDDHNTRNNVDKSELLNGRNLTNIGIFRKYMYQYAENHPAISKDMTLMARLMEPTDHGVAIELYCFSTEQAWVNYEAVMGDIFDHFIAAAPYFDLEVFESPAGSDITKALKNTNV